MDEINKVDQKSDQSIEQTDTKISSAVASPNNNNNSDLSNSSTSNVSTSESSEILQQDCNEKSTKRKNCSNKENGGNSEKAKILSSVSSVSSTIKEDGSVVVKKEETTLSPVGFDSISNAEIKSGCIASTAKSSDLSSLVPKNKSSEKSSSPNRHINGKEECSVVANNSSVNSSTVNSGLHQQASFGCTGNSISNCLEYMQQQNHIFVFSTQLANKGAESVLSGQFQTIIAYHCTQPSTKSFLEAFFMKNPMKMAKLPRNMLGMGQNTQWISGGNAAISNANSVYGGISKSISKGTNNKVINFNLSNTSIDQKPQTCRTGIAPGNVNRFMDGNESDSELMQCWENNRNIISDDVKVGDGLETAHLLNKNATLEAKLGHGGNDQIPSLQGVKVPDENLTPQQRQHREEQLAKLKKMNQFLFPENDTSQAAQQINKISNDNGTSNVNNLMINLVGQQSNVPGLSQMSSTLRNNLIVNQKQPSTSLCENDNITGLGSVSNSDQLSSENMVPLQSKNISVSCSSLISNPINLNLPVNTMSCLPQTSNMLNTNETSIVSNGAFNQCGRNDEKIITNSAMLAGSQDVTLDWPKIQNQYLDERLKGNKPPNEIGINRLNLSSGPISGNVRNNLTSTTSSGNSQRSGQGPPPPYHSTQRSASVPIATQSPNPSSPNNPTSNLSLPSPASAAPTGVTLSNSPNLDIGNLSNIPCSSNNSIVTHTSSVGHMNKVGFPQEGTSSLNNSNTNRSRNNHNQLNSNPSTPLSHMSPKDLEAFNTNNGSDSQQSNIDRFPSASPGFSFPPHIQNSTGTSNSFKAQHDRQNATTGVNSPFGRRSENIPLNPNSSRTTQNKLGDAPFDPISSLAQMSQQLTNCISSGVSNSPSNVSCNDLNMTSNIGMNHQNIDGMLQNVESSIIESGTGSGIFGPSNCNTIIMGSINPQHRLINTKVCGASGGFNNSVNNNPGSFHPGVLPSNHHHRLRMPGGLNFNNFNVSPNIQVKASTPNTIQYMPVRPQNNNNMRAPPSLDFLQRYANPTHLDGGIGPIDNHGGNHLATGAPDSSKMVNNLSNGSGIGTNMNFFQHCNQIESDDIGNGSLLPVVTDVNVIRGLRPMLRQHMAGNVNVPQRIIAPSNTGPTMQYSGGPPTTQDTLDCGDMSNLFGTGSPGTNPSQLYHIAGGTHKPGKSSGMAMTTISGSGGNSILSHDHNGISSPMNQGAIVGQPLSGSGPQIPIVSSGTTVNNINYKTFVGPASNDIKYAQQYHSFQQQLYATSTRSHHQNGNNVPNANNVQNSNTQFFVNK